MGALGSFPRISPMLWFDNNAEEAVNFYLGVFRNSRRLNSVRDEAGVAGPKNRALTIAFEIEGQTFTALNGGPHFRFTEATSWVVRCESQDEIDYYWSRLAEGGAESQCGWLKDRFGMSWQVVPAGLAEWIRNPLCARCSA